LSREVLETSLVSALRASVRAALSREVLETSLVSALRASVRAALSREVLERAWLRAFLRAGESYHSGALEQELFGEDRRAWPTRRDNLPPLRSDFIGRIEEIGRVRKGLAMPHPLLSIEGIGGQDNLGH
jgi:hypothetical protein